MRDIGCYTQFCPDLPPLLPSCSDHSSLPYSLQEEKLNTDVRGSTFIPLILPPPATSTTDEIMTVDKVNEQEGSGIDEAVEEEVVLIDESLIVHENINPVRELQPHDLRYMTNQVRGRNMFQCTVSNTAEVLSLVQ